MPRTAALLLLVGFRALAANPLLDDVTLYASFDEAVRADHGSGRLEVGTRFRHESEAGRFVFEPGYPSEVFRIARGRGISGGALEVLDVLPRSGRLYFPAAGNLAFRKGGWGGTVSFWLRTDPNVMLKTRFCDPVQITEKGANDGGLWVDFPDTSPRSFRLGAFPAQGPGHRRIAESDPDAPLVVVPNVGFRADRWHHVAFTWRNFDTGRADAEAALYIDGDLQGVIAGREIAMDWDLDRTGIYFAVGYIGWMDELAVFRRPLQREEIRQLRRDPAALGNLKRARQQ